MTPADLNARDLKIDIFTRGDGWREVKIVHIPTGVEGKAEGRGYARVRDEALVQITKGLAERRSPAP
jgi:protein subunit release factor A